MPFEKDYEVLDIPLQFVDPIFPQKKHPIPSPIEEGQNDLLEPHVFPETITSWMHYNILKTINP